MELNEAERITVAKPIASRPTCSNVQSFSELLASAISSSSSRPCSDAAVPPIKPKTVRVKSTAIPASVDVFPWQGLKSDDKSTVIYKPLAKLVKTTMRHLTNSGDLGSNHQQAIAQVEARAQYSKNYCGTQLTSSLQQNHLSVAETFLANQSPNAASKSSEDAQLQLATSGDRASYDGYSWRKYGQKQVKGSEYPRSYYKCTNPNCPVKKKVERSHDGQIAEIVYKGEHNHLKPRTPKHNSARTLGQGFLSHGTVNDATNTLCNISIKEMIEGSEARVENRNELGLSSHSTHSGKAPLSYNLCTTGLSNAGITTSDNSCGFSGGLNEGSKEADDDEPKSKKRKSENQSTEAGVSGEGVQNPRIIVQNSTDSEIFGDGFRWRKYGQKVVKGNPYPRSYYRCTALKCNVRKHVERSSDNPRAFITTYEGKHNHNMPTEGTNPVAFKPDPQDPINSKNNF